MLLSVKRIRAKFLEDAPPGNALVRLNYSWDIRQTIDKVRKHQWRKSDVQYLIMFILFVFNFCIITQPFLIKAACASLLLIACLLPITSQFFFRALPILTWVLLFFSCRYIPHSIRPRIYVRVLPAMETILYGGNLSEILATKTNPVLDILAWLPYGIIHFTSPFVVAALVFIFCPPKTLPVFGFAFGWMNTVGVLIQLCFPTAPPWYQIIHGLEPANYGMPGSPGGLARIDQLLGLNMYTGTFTTAPLVFGAFPSLHSACATMDVLFLAHMFPRYSAAFYAYILWIWWSTMYLTHHYFVDLIGGSILSFVVFYSVKRTCLPRMQHDKFARWSYDYIETGEEEPTKLRKSIDSEYELPLYAEDEESSLSKDVPLHAGTPGSSRASLPPINTNLPGHANSAAAAIVSKSIHHSHHKTSSSCHLYDSDVYATSASSTPVGSSHPMSPLASGNGIFSPLSSRPSSTSPVIGASLEDNISGGKLGKLFTRLGSPVEKPEKD